MKQGIDVSKWQPKVDWQKVKADGIDFAIIRVGFCYNNGALKLDSAFTQHIKGALAAGLDVGIYLYSYATTVQAARRAAQEVVKAVKPYKLTYPIAFDIEYESIYTGGTDQHRDLQSVPGRGGGGWILCHAVLLEGLSRQLPLPCTVDRL